jgi:hypothetical protein
MFGKLFEDVVAVAGDVARVVVAPVEVAATVAKAVTKPVADAATEVVRTVRDVVE